jgi:serpin B
MGLSSIFTDAADLSGMSDEKDLRVGQVIQQVFLEVNEKGTEAAAATAVTIVTVGARLNPPKPKPFVVDRPFVILIKDEVTGAVMFAGRITNP